MEVTNQVIKKIAERAATGLAKYGQTLDRKDLTYRDWLIHLQEELMDATQYIEKILEELEENKCNKAGTANDAIESTHHLSQAVPVAQKRPLRFVEELIWEEELEQRMQGIHPLHRS